jgi:L-rhamnose isomerase
MYPWQRWEKEMSNKITDLERTSLEAHVDLCEMRYQALDQRLTKVETKLDEIKSDLTKFRLDFFKIMVGTGGTVVVAVIGAVATILVKVL